MTENAELIEKTLTVTAGLGLHARVATMMVRAMQNFDCQVTLVKDGVEVDARSVLGLLLLAAAPGSRIIVRAQGADSLQAIEEIARLIQDDEATNN